ncbi:hypothetical protein ACTXT7_001120 [Hymenolepis weldensis]
MLGTLNTTCEDTLSRKKCEISVFDQFLSAADLRLTSNLHAAMPHKLYILEAISSVKRAKHQ